MSSKDSPWYRLGFAFERAREAPTRGTRKLASLKERASLPSLKKDESPAALDLNEVITTAAVALAAKALDRWGPGKSGGLLSTVRAAAAGAGAAVVIELVRPLLAGEAEIGSLDDQTPDRVLAGAVQGLVYGTLLEPWIPGPPLLKGAVYGGAEYVAMDVGGISKLLGGHSAVGKLPGLGPMLTELDPQERAFVEHVLFGVALAVLYGSSRSSSGMRVDGE